MFTSPSQHVDVEILNRTGGKGVDVVINSRTERELQQSVRSVRYHGVILHLSSCEETVNSKIGKN